MAHVSRFRKFLDRLLGTTDFVSIPVYREDALRTVIGLTQARDVLVKQKDSGPVIERLDKQMVEALDRVVGTEYLPVPRWYADAKKLRLYKKMLDRSTIAS